MILPKNSYFCENRGVQSHPCIAPSYTTAKTWNHITISFNVETHTYILGGLICEKQSKQDKYTMDPGKSSLS